MGSFSSILEVTDNNLQFYNYIYQENLEGKILKVIDVNMFVLVVRHNGIFKKFIC